MPRERVTPTTTGSRATSQLPLVGPGEPSPSRAVLAYNALRLLLLGAALGIGYLVGLRGLLLVVVALLVSGIASWFLLKRQRLGMGLAVERTIERGRSAMAVRTTAEDAADDAARREPPGRP